MRTTAVLRGVLVLGACVIAPGLTGCQYGCEADHTCPRESTDDGCFEDPADATGPIPEKCGVWVSATRGADDGPGSRASPVRRLSTAINLARSGSKRVYACGELFEERVSLPAGISLFGGFDCKDGWAYVGAAKRAVLAPEAGPAVLTLMEGTGTSFLGDLSIEAADAVAPGGSSIAVLVGPKASAELRRSDVVAGNGADGADGDAGEHAGEPAQDGRAGKDGADACTMDAGNGGEQVTLDCGDTVTIGGEGGNGGEAWANAGSDGHPAPAGPDPEGYGAGGNGENAAQGLACTPGLGGAQGIPGKHGLGAHGLGRLTIDGYIGVAGGDGKPGTPGQGGGGGGASMGSAFCGAAPHGGAGGGSGGTGGCGGKGGKGGRPGGSSIGIAAVGNGLATGDVRIAVGNGGQGGNGGVLQPGGKGGLPGLGGGGVGGNGGAQYGCAGGAGGPGGNGGDGGGGHGGHSLGIANAGAVDVLLFGHVDWSLGSPGQGGKGGNPALTECEGEDGKDANNRNLEP